MKNSIGLFSPLFVEMTVVAHDRDCGVPAVLKQPYKKLFNVAAAISMETCYRYGTSVKFSDGITRYFQETPEQIQALITTATKQRLTACGLGSPAQT
jgi:hypothetical protein